ncbi:MAG: PQQ-binding-like beta-propeller repeat protein [Methanomicrobiales archaeon]
MASIQTIPGNSECNKVESQKTISPKIRWLVLLLFLGTLITAPVLGAPGWKFHSDLANSGVYDDGGTSPDGTLLWNYTAGDGVSTNPAVVNGIVYFGSHDKNLYALDAATGALNWNYTTNDPFGWESSSPAVTDGIVYIGGITTKLYALDAATGMHLWDYTVPANTTTRSDVSSSPAVANGVVYVGNFDGNLYAFNTATHALLWNFTTGNYVFSSPAVANGVVYFGSCDNNLYALDAVTGAMLWNYTTGAQVLSSPAVANGVVYVGSRDNNLYALDAATGTHLWNYTTGSYVDSSPAVANGVVYFGSLDNNTYALDATTGALLWNFTTGNRVGSSPAVANGVIYIGSRDNNTYALDAATGAPHWKYTTRGSVTSSPAVANGVVYFGSQDRNLYALGFSPESPPDSITNLHPTINQQDRITWNWTDPTSNGFSHVMVYLDGVFRENVTKGIGTWTATGLHPGTAYSIGTRTVGTGGLINETLVESTARTEPATRSMAWKFRSDLNNSGVFDDGGKRPEGALLWNYTAGGNISSSPAVVDGVVYVGSWDDNLYAFNETTGAFLWKYNTTETPNPYVSSSPAVVDGVVYIGGARSKIQAIDADTGALLWKYTTSEQYITRAEVSSSPAVANGVVYVGNYDSNIYAFNTSTGDLLWNYTIGNEKGFWSSPAVANGAVYAGCYDGKLYALDAGTGTPLWNYTTGGQVWSSPAVANGVVYFGSNDNNLYALDAATGALRWNYTTNGGVRSSPAVVNGVVYVGSSDNNLYALDAATGALRWNYKTGDIVRSSPAVANGVVYFGSWDTNLYALEVSTGTLLWKYKTGGPVVSSPAVANGAVYVGSRDGNLYAIGTSPKKPPASISNLHATSIRQDQITWAWNDPLPLSAEHVMVYLDGVFQENVSWLIQTYTATGLTPGTAYTISTRTVGWDGLINATWVNQTVTTRVLWLSELDPPDVIEGSPAFILNVYGIGFTPGSTILWNGEWQTTQYLSYGQLSMEVPAEKIAHPHLVNITVYDSSLIESSNSVFLPVTSKSSDAKAWKFRSEIYNTGVYDDGGISPDGTLLWNYTTGGRISSSPAVANGVVYVGSQDSNLYAVDAKTGTFLWNYKTNEPSDWVSSSPAVANGIVYIGGMKTKLYALDAATGSLLWNYTVPKKSTTIASVSSSPAVANGVVYIGNFDGNIYAFNAYTGALLWNYTTGNYVFSSPAVANGVVYVGSDDHNLYALDAATGMPLWNYTTGGRVFSSPAVANEVVYFSSYDNITYALDAKTGALLWNYTTGYQVDSSPAVANGIVYIGSYDKNLHALNAKTGNLLWNYATGHIVRSCPAVANGVVYFGSWDNNTYALDAATGTLLWNYRTGGSITSSPAIVNGVVYIGSNDKNLYALGSTPITGGGKGYYRIHSNVDGADVYFNGDWFEGTITNGTLLVETCTTCTPVWTYTVKKCGYFAMTQNNTRYPGNNETIDLYANLTPPREPLIADFTSNITSGPAPLSVGFTSQSVGIAETWNWSFGDGTYSDEKKPIHTYTTDGVYTVILSETNSACQNDSIVKKDYIIASKSPGPSFIADFTVSPVTGTAPLTVKCTDKSVGNPTMLVYDFGDGTNVTGPNPTHTYRFPGVYTITLSIMKYNTTTYSIMGSTATKQNAITVNSVPVVPLVAKFAASPVSGTAPLAVSFTDQSTGNPSFLNYDFGDGINATGKNPVHSYRFPGVYNVTLSIFKFDSSSGSMLSNASVQKGLIVVNGI